MPTPLSTAGAASGSDAWQELEEVLASLGQMARSPIDPEQFYERVLVECVRALSAVGGAAWLRAPTGALCPVAHVNWPGAEIAASPDARRAHEALLSSVAAEGRIRSSATGTIIAPVQLALDDQAADPLHQTVAILELMSRADASPATYRGYEQFLAAVCELAAEYHAFRELTRLRQNENYRDELVRLSTLVHRSIELTPTAYAVANEGRRVIGCDRLSVLATVGRRSRLLATSGASHVERRSSAARRMEELAELVRPTAEPAWYADGQSDALPPIADALEAHAEESHARRVAVVPLARPIAGELALASGSNSPSHREKPSFVLVAEQFDARTGSLAPERLLEVAELSATALYNALEVDRLPFRWLLRPLAGAKRQVANHVARSTVIAALIAVLLLAQTAVIPANVVTWTLQQPRPVRAGEAVSLTLTATIAPGWHLYAMAQPEGGPISTEVSLPATALATFARPIVASKPATIVDPNFDLRVQLYSESATFTLPLRVAATAPAGAHPFAVEARYQSCNDVICLPPKAVRIETTLTIRSR